MNKSGSVSSLKPFKYIIHKKRTSKNTLFDSLISYFSTFVVFDIISCLSIVKIRAIYKVPDQLAVGLTNIAAPSAILSVIVGFLLYKAPPSNSFLSVFFFLFGIIFVDN